MKWSSLTVILVILNVVLLTALGVFFFYKPAPNLPIPATKSTTTQNTVLKGPGNELGATMSVYVNEHDLIGAFEVVDVDLTRNTRKVVWFFSDIQGINLIYKKYEATKVGDTPWLSSNPEVNARQLSIINGAYNCVPIEATPLARVMPGLDTHVKFICVVAIPPDYGKFSGYLAAWMTRVPTDEEIHRLVEKLREFAARVY